MSRVKKTQFLSAALLIGMLLSCSNNPTASVPTAGAIKISIRSVGTAAAGTLPKVAGVATITSARVVIDEIEFESSVRDSIDFEFEDPFVQDLMLDTSLQVISTVQVPFGTYEEMEIEIDKLSPRDSTVYAQNPDLQNLSVRVEGYLDGDPANTFVFTSALSAEQEREFNPPLLINETTPSRNIVMTIDTSVWFVDRNNNPIDPTVAANQRLIENNIKASIKVFSDDDDNGIDDDGDDDDDDDDGGDD